MHKSKTYLWDLIFGCVSGFFSRAMLALIPTYGFALSMKFMPQGNSALFWWIASFNYGSRIIYPLFLSRYGSTNRFQENQIYNLVMSLSMLVLALLPGYQTIGYASAIIFAFIVVVTGIFNACEFPRVYQRTLVALQKAVEQKVIHEKTMNLIINLLSVITFAPTVIIGWLSNTVDVQLSCLLLAVLGILLILIKQFHLKKHITIFDISTDIIAPKPQHNVKSGIVHKLNNIDFLSYFKHIPLNDILLIAVIVIFNENCNLNGKWVLEFSKRTNVLHPEYAYHRVKGMTFSLIFKLLFFHHVLNYMGLYNVVYCGMLLSLISTPLTFILAKTVLGSWIITMINYTIAGIYSSVFLLFLQRFLCAGYTDNINDVLNITTGIVRLTMDFIPSLLCYSYWGGLTYTLMYNLSLGFICALGVCLVGIKNRKQTS